MLVQHPGVLWLTKGNICDKLTKKERGIRLEEKTQVKALSSLKGLFIWVIVLHNTLSIDAVLDGVPGVAFLKLFGGSLGNSIFFMLSGFLIALSYRKRIEGGSVSLKDFLVRRLKKLYPMYLLTNLAALAVEVWQYGVSAINLKRIAFTILLQAGGGLGELGPYNSPTWFVSALFLCYLLYYVGTSCCKTNGQYCGFLAVFIAVGYYFSGTQLQVPFCYYGNGLAYMNFFLGCVLAELLPAVRPYARKLKIGALVLLVASVYLMLGYGVEIISGGVDGAFAFWICPMVLYLAWEDGICSRILSRKPFVWLGDISMSVFYWHLVVYFALRHLFGSMTVTHYGVYVLILLAVSGLTRWRLKAKKTVAV